MTPDNYDNPIDDGGSPDERRRDLLHDLQRVCGDYGVRLVGGMIESTEYDMTRTEIESISSIQCTAHDLNSGDTIELGNSRSCSWSRRRQCADAAEALRAAGWVVTDPTEADGMRAPTHGSERGAPPFVAAIGIVATRGDARLVVDACYGFRPRVSSAVGPVLEAIEIVRRHLAIPRDLSPGERDLLAIRRYIRGVVRAVEMAAKVARTLGDGHRLMAMGAIAGFFDEAAQSDDATLRLVAEMPDGAASPEPKAGA